MRFGFRALVRVVGFTSVSLVEPAIAPSPAYGQAGSSEVVWIWGLSSRTDCPAQRDLQLAVEERLSSPGLFGAFDAPGINLRLRAISDESTDGTKRLNLQLETTQGGLLGVRSLQASTCGEMTELSSLVVALMVEPYLKGSEPEDSPEVAASSDFELAVPDQPIAKAEQVQPIAEALLARPTAKAARPMAESPRLAREAERARPMATPRDEAIPTFRFACLTRGKLILGFGPAIASPALGLSCGIGIVQSFTAELGAEYRVPTRHPSGDFSLQAGAIDARGCRARGREWQWGGCAGVGLSWMLFKVSTPTTPETDQRPVGEFLAHLRAQRRVRRLLLRIDVGASLPWQRPRYTLLSSSGATATLHQSWTILPWMEMSGGWVFR